MKQVIFHAPIIELRPQRLRSTPCTLLLPAHLATYVHSQRFGVGLPGFSAYLRVLIRQYRFSVVANGQLRREALVAQYQATGLSLKRIHFRPEAQLWHQVTLLARHLGLSRCRLIVLMIQWDAGLVPALPSVGVPTTIGGGLQDHECMIVMEKIHTWEDRYSRTVAIGLNPEVMDAYLSSPFRRKRRKN